MKLLRLPTIATASLWGAAAIPFVSSVSVGDKVSGVFSGGLPCMCLVEVCHRTGAANVSVSCTASWIDLLMRCI